MSIGFYLISLTLSLLAFANVVNDDNYIVFSSDYDGLDAVPSKDGFLYIIGSSIAKMKMEDRTIVKSVLITHGDFPSHMGQAIISEDSKTLVVTREPLDGGPDCRIFFVFETENLSLTDI